MEMDTPRGDGNEGKAHAPTSVPDFKEEPFSLVPGTLLAEPSECLLPFQNQGRGGMYVWLPLRMWLTTREMRGTESLNTVSRHTKQANCYVLALPITLSSLS